MYFITGNSHKYKEIREIFNKASINLTVEMKDLNPLEIQSEDLKEVALFKLKSVKEKINDSCFVEDAGFFVDHPLNGFPGVYSAPIFRKIGNNGILRLIDNFSESKAHFMAVIALYYKPQEEIHLFTGEIHGRVSDKIRGTHGFGYDPIFIPDSIPDKTFAELTREEKNKISHRGIAINKLIEFFKMRAK